MTRPPLSELDRRWTQHLSIADRDGFLRSLSMVLAHSGDSWFWLLALFLVAVGGAGQWRRWAVQVGAVIIVAAALVLLVKFTVRRRRPEGAWGEIYRRTDPHSFPSGHAVRALMLATLAAGWGPAWLFPALAVWAPLVVLARVAMGVHYLSDVIVGALLGLFLGGLALALLPPPL